MQFINSPRKVKSYLHSNYTLNWSRFNLNECYSHLLNTSFNCLLVAISGVFTSVEQQLLCSLYLTWLDMATADNLQWPTITFSPWQYHTGCVLSPAVADAGD